jgi:hypothetical protein
MQGGGPLGNGGGALPPPRVGGDCAATPSGWGWRTATPGHLWGWRVATPSGRRRPPTGSHPSAFFFFSFFLFNFF